MMDKICQSEEKQKTNDFGYYHHYMSYFTKSFVKITFHQFGMDVMYGKLFAATA